MDRSNRWLHLVTFVSSITLPALAQNAASDAYAPVPASCPATLVRSASSGPNYLSPQEAEYISGRQLVLPTAWSAYLENVKAHASAHDVQLPDYVEQLLGGKQVADGMTLGVAVSGGGYRAAITGAGILNALDARNTTSVQAGTGGLLQGASYISGLSGGSWLISGLTEANFPPIYDLIFGTSSDKSANESSTFGGILSQYGYIDASSNPIVGAQYISTVVKETNGKKAAGFPVTFTDVWARAVSRHWVNGTTSNNFFNTDVKHGAGQLWSNAVNTPTFSSHQQPFPIVVADSISSKENATYNMDDGFGVPISNPMYEFNPYEFGSYDPMLSSFVPMKYMGSSGGKCVTGFDQLSYVQAISSNVFNGAESDVVNKLVTALKVIDGTAGSGSLAAQIPNPFKGLSPSTYIESDDDVISLGDGGLDGQEIPLQPLLVKGRGVDVIVALDLGASGTDNHPSGGSLIDTGKRATLFSSTYSFPPVPSSTEEFAKHGLLDRPVFFGCNATDSPLVIYIANTTPLGQTPATNTPTAQFAYLPNQVSAMLDQAFDVATQGIHTGNKKDPEWPVCLACAVVDRARAKAGTARSGACDSCMTRYCWSS